MPMGAIQPNENDPFAELRRRLVMRIRDNTQLDDRRILAAFEQVPRHLFVDESKLGQAYEDRALAIGEEQTISQPSMIALMLHALDPQPDQRALEVGAGSGYAAAVLSRLVREVFAIEVRETLAMRARRNLVRAGIENVRVISGDGSRGLPEHAPYDRILVSAAAASIPEVLVEQLAPGGRIAAPVGSELYQVLTVGARGLRGQIEWTRSVPCVFVPLLEGEE
jgi:protein-L-isoaspartate(D-aspartate) O-methyltransferase